MMYTRLVSELIQHLTGKINSITDGTFVSQTLFSQLGTAGARSGLDPGCGTRHRTDNSVSFFYETYFSLFVFYILASPIPPEFGRSN
uniref:Uncharacterized protein n=1 Tax=Anguilla anguilla TaxID=7936 RepID=A0A0E9UXZ2_ANGAN